MNSSADKTLTLGVDADDGGFLDNKAIWANGKITNNPIAVKSIDASQNINEGDDLFYTIKLSGKTSGVTPLYLRASSDDLTDFDLDKARIDSGATGHLNLQNGGAIQVNGNTDTVVLKVPTVDDLDRDKQEEVLTLSANIGDSYRSTQAKTGDGSIAPNDDLIAVSVSDSKVKEGQPLVFDIKLKEALPSAARLWLKPGLLTAANDDLQLNRVQLSSGLTGTVNLTAGKATEIRIPKNLDHFTLSIPTVNDQKNEGDESMTLAVDGGNQFDMTAAAVGTGTIIDENLSLTVTPVGGLNFKYDAANQSFNDEAALFKVAVSSKNIEEDRSFTLEARAGSQKTLQSGSNSIEVSLVADSQPLDSSEWLSLIDGDYHYSGLDSITGKNGGTETGVSQFTARPLVFKNSGEKVSAKQLADGQYRGTVTAEFKATWKMPEVKN